jgi:hypothetical protein
VTAGNTSIVGISAEIKKQSLDLENLFKNMLTEAALDLQKS